MSEPSVTSPCGRYRIIPATIGGAKRVLDNLSRIEDEERKRLGLSGYNSVFAQVVNDNAWLIILTARGNEELAVFGVSPEGYVWLLPTQECATTYKRSLVNRVTVKWVLDWIWSTVSRDEEMRMPALFNGVTDEAPSVQRWLKRVVGAKFWDKTIQCDSNGHPIRPFCLRYAADYV